MTLTSKQSSSDFKDAAIALIQGNLVAFPTETVYGLGADATNEYAVDRIYTVKGRPKDHPLIVHISSVDLLDKWAKEIPKYAIQLANRFWPGPMTLVLSRTGLAKNFITGNQDTVALRVPSHPLAFALLKEFEKLGGVGVAAPSANKFGKVSPTSVKAVEIAIGEELTPLDKILDGGPSKIGIESTIIDCTGITPRILRPGFITYENLCEIIDMEAHNQSYIDSIIKVPGSFQSHYAPEAKVFIGNLPFPGDGFIALSTIPTPKGVIRLASPSSIEEFAHILYNSLLLADLNKIQRVFIDFSNGPGIKVAINDRIRKIVNL